MKRHFVIICSLIVGLTSISAQEVPSINPTATYIDSTGKEEQSENYSGQAPLIGRFEANPYDTSGWNEYYEWRFTREQEGEVNREPYLIRYEQDTEYTFTESGLHKIVCYAVFTQGNDTIAYTQDYWDDEMVPLKVTISESKLTMPNAFSPNGDEFNNTYKAKEYQSIVEFHAIIFNRWGQKIYEWFDPAGHLIIHLRFTPGGIRSQ